jgi:hypothetical protein
MAKGKTSFVCLERKIGTGRWRWAVTYLGECLGSGIVKTQAECRKHKDRVKAEFLAKHPPEQRDLTIDAHRGKGLMGRPYGGDWRHWGTGRGAPSLVVKEKTHFE